MPAAHRELLGWGGGPAPQQAGICLHGALPGLASGHLPARVDRAGRDQRGSAGDLGESCHCETLKSGTYSMPTHFCEGTWPAAHTAPPTVPGLRLPCTYRQNESRERGQLAGVSVDPLLQLQDGARPKRGVLWGGQGVGHGREAHGPRIVKEPTPRVRLPGALQATPTISKGSFPLRGCGPSQPGSRESPRPPPQSPLGPLSTHKGSRQNYLSGPPWPRSAGSPGRSRRPAGSTGSGGATEGMNEA